jgi:FkbM family methyltransferase
VKRLRYLIGLIFLLKNWPEVLWRFVAKTDGSSCFRFRDGLVIRYAHWIEVEEIIGTFVRRDYGKPSPGKLVVDVGASLGSFSLDAARQGAKVLAYEPAPESFELFSKTIKLNRLEGRIKPFRLGVSGRAGKRAFFLTRFSPLSSFFGGGGNKISVDCITLEDIFKKHRLKKLDLLKLDCEGAEYEILYETPTEILEKIKEIRLEYHLLPAKRANPTDLTDFLLEHGFALVRQRHDAPISGILWFIRLPSEALA